MSTVPRAFIMHCAEAKCEGRCICTEPTGLMLTCIQGEENQTTGASADLVVSRVTATNIANGGDSVLRNRYKKLEEDTRCLCHEKPKPTDRKARNKLIAACMTVFIFMIGEIIGKLTRMY